MDKDQDLNVLTVDQLCDLFHRLYENKSGSLTISGYVKEEDGLDGKKVPEYNVHLAVCPKEGAWINIEERGPDLKKGLISCMKFLFGT